MKRKTFTLILVLCFGMMACHRRGSVNIANQLHRVKLPDGTLAIAENFYADEAEVSNRAYRRYLQWLAEVYGRAAAAYQAALPDTLVWQANVSYGEPYSHNYFRHPAYDDFPVVGINLSQAQAYAAWRTERNAASILLAKGYIKPNKKLTVDSYFTRERYAKGKYDWIVKKVSLALPVFKVPNRKEWEEMVGREEGLAYGTDRHTRHNQKVYQQYGCLFHTSDGIRRASKKGYRNKKMPMASRAMAKNKYGLYGMIGNVAELVEEGVCKGGSWRDRLSDITLTKDEVFERATHWIGFRNVCSFVWLEVGEE